MTLFDLPCDAFGIITGIDGDAVTHRRLADMGLIGATFRIRARKSQAVLVDFDTLSAFVIERKIAEHITAVEVIETDVCKNRAVRQPECR